MNPHPAGTNLKALAAKAKTEELELTVLTQCRFLRLPEPVRQLRFDPERKWAFDLAWPDYMVAVEVEGGQWIPGGGRHQRGKGLDEDASKYNHAAIGGWLVLRITTDMVNDGRGVKFIERALQFLEENLQRG